jgi:ketosteroid isomerase-like protein
VRTDGATTPGRTAARRTPKRSSATARSDQLVKEKNTVSNADIIKRMYAAKGDMNVISAAISPDAQWDITEGFPHGGVHDAFDAIVNDFFSFFGDFDEFWAEGDEFWEVDDKVIALGRYEGKAKATGERFSSRFVHIYTLRDDKITRLQQTADTVQISRALGMK